MTFSNFKIFEMKYADIFYSVDNFRTYPSPIDKRVKLVIDPRSYQTENNMWHVKPFAKSGNSYFIVCPLCGEIHLHGRGDGHRWNHCKEPKPEDKGYVLEGTDYKTT